MAEKFTLETFFFSLVFGLLFSSLLFFFEKKLKPFSFIQFNLILLGLFLGSLLGYVLNLYLEAFSIFTNPKYMLIVKNSVYIASAYIAIGFSMRFYKDLGLINNKKAAVRSKDMPSLWLDNHCLLDGRIVDLALSGILDENLSVPRFIVDELLVQVESLDEIVKMKAKRSIEILKKLENIEGLKLSFIEDDDKDISDPYLKLIKLARLNRANILTADLSRLQVSNVEGVKIINLHMLSNALKPLTQSGELLRVKVQRVGKEPRQGVGYLEDGTMIVINGGGDKIAETVVARVLSVKYTATGRMIFCNLLEEDEIMMSLPENEGVYL
jgi:uncharacterized protein YacL